MFTSAAFSNFRIAGRLPTSLRRHSCKMTVSLSVAAALETVAFVFTGPFAAVAGAALEFESVMAVRAGAGCSDSFLPVTLILHHERWAIHKELQLIKPHSHPLQLDGAASRASGGGGGGGPPMDFQKNAAPLDVCEMNRKQFSMRTPPAVAPTDGWKTFVRPSFPLCEYKNRYRKWLLILITV